MKTVKVTERALFAIRSLPDYSEIRKYWLTVGDVLEVNGCMISEEDNVAFLCLEYCGCLFNLRADLFDFDLEAYKAESAKEEEELKKARLQEKRQSEHQEFLERYNWDDLRCKAAVAAMQGFIITGIDDQGNREDNIKYLVSASVQVADALVKELQEA